MTTALHHLSQSALFELVLVQQQELIVKDDSIRHHEARIFDLEFQIKELQRLVFGAKRERFISEMNDTQLALHFEPHDTEVAAAVAAELETITYERRKPQQRKHAGRMALPQASACC
ncbi:MAG: hypothetical protein HYX66_04115 [Ignavibacteria bacterium]|nr:hypothetical protein [Ignavibacteria bacterium]